MKKKHVFLIALLLFVVALLSSCRIADSGTGNISGSLNDANSDAKAVYGPGIQTTVIVPQNAEFSSGAFASITGVSNELYSYFGNLVHVRGDDKVKDTNEIVVGDTNREISSQALYMLQRRFDRVIEEYPDSSFIMGYGIYAYQGSVAIVFTDIRAAEVAVNHFIENYVTDKSLVLEDGYFAFESFDYIEFLKAEENEERELALAIVEADYGQKTAEALRDYLSLFDERFYLWIADLYEPGEYDEDGNPLGGGFYYSNSARNTPGFGPDLESTYQIMNFLISSGMASSSDELKATLPESMFGEIAAFVIDCQSPIDGYFYHPQWGSSVSVSRRGRDLDWAKYLLNLCGVSPKWNTPNGVSGSEGAPPGVAPVALTSRISESSVVAVSKVVSTTSKSWTGDSNLSTLKAWEDHIKSYEDTIHTSSYAIGNTFAAQASQIISRDKLAITSGELRDANGDGIADGGYIEIWEKYFNDWQLSSNGLWKEGSVEDGTMTYNAVNGLMKIASVYNSLGIKINYADKAFEAAMFMAKHIGISQDGDDWGDAEGKKPDWAVDQYNVFQAMSFVLKNIENFGSLEQHTKLKNLLKANATELIETTLRKVSKFKKSDGSFGYSWGSPPHLSQGAPVSVEGVVEGDVNGATISARSTMGTLLGLLDIKNIKMYAYSDLLVFANRIGQLDPVIKDGDEINPEENIRTFEEEDITDGELPEYMTKSFNRGSAKIVKDANNIGNRYLELLAVPGTSGNSVYFTTTRTRNVQSLVLEWDMKFENINASSSTALQIFIGSSYMFTVAVNTDGTFTLGDSSTSGVGIKNTFNETFNAGEWNNIRLEFYVTNPETHSTVTYVYVNDYLRFISDNYYGKEKDASVQMLTYDKARFFALAATDLTLCLDNVNAYQSNVRYTEKDVENPDRIKHFDDVEVGGDTLPVDVTTIGGEVVCVPNSDNKNNNAIVIDKLGERVSVAPVPIPKVANCYAAYMKMNIDSSTLGEVANIRFTWSATDASILAYNIEVYEDDGERYARIVEFNSKGEHGQTYDGLETDKWIELGFEFYPYFYDAEASSIVYLDGKELGRSNCYFDKETLSLDYTALIISAEADAKLALDDIVAELTSKKFVNSNGQQLDNPNVSLPKPGKWGEGSYYGDDSYTDDAKYSYDGMTSVTRNDLLTSDSPLDKSTVEDDALKISANIALKNGGAKTGGTYVFETDLYLIGSAATKEKDTIGWLGMSASGAARENQFAAFTINYEADANGKITRVCIVDTAATNIVYAELELDTWQNIRIEYTPNAVANTGTIKFYLNGELVKENENSKGYNGAATNSNSLFECFGIQLRSSSSSGYKGALRMDNTFMSAVGEVPQLPENPEPENPEPENPNPDEPIIDDRGKGVYYTDSAYTEAYKHSYDGITPSGYSGLAIQSSALVSVVDGALTLNGAATGNKVAIKNQASKTGAKYVLETDLSVDFGEVTANSGYLGWFGMSSADGYSKATQFMSFTIQYTASAGKITRVYLRAYANVNNGVEYTDIELGAWQNLRIEYTPLTETTGKVELYINNELVKTVSSTVGYSSTVSNTTYECFNLETRSVSNSGAQTTLKFDNTFIGAIGDAPQLPENPEPENPEPENPTPDVPAVDGRGNGVYYNNVAYADTNKHNYDGITPSEYAGLKVGTVSKVSIVDGALNLDGSAGGHKIAIKNQGSKTGTKYIFETDLSVNFGEVTAASGHLGWFGMSSTYGLDKATQFMSFTIQYTASAGKITRVYLRAYANVNNGVEYTDIELGAWQNLRIEYTPLTETTGKVELYINNELVKTVSSTVGYSSTVSNTAYECFNLQLRNVSDSKAQSTIKFDNTFIGAITEE